MVMPFNPLPHMKTLKLCTKSRPAFFFFAFRFISFHCLSDWIFLLNLNESKYTKKSRQNVERTQTSGTKIYLKKNKKFLRQNSTGIYIGCILKPFILQKSTAFEQHSKLKPNIKTEIPFCMRLAHYHTIQRFVRCCLSSITSISIYYWHFVFRWSVS